MCKFCKLPRIYKFLRDNSFKLMYCMSKNTFDIYKILDFQKSSTDPLYKRQSHLLIRKFIFQ